MRFNAFMALGIAAMALTFTSCKSKKMITESSTSYATFNISCLHSNGDGTETVQAWGQGKDYETAAEAARRNAVREMIFKGITSGSKGCNIRPIVPEVNAEEKYSYYFDKFFANGGAYTKYVSKPSDQKNGIRANKSTGMMSASVQVTVNRSALRQRLIDDEILKP